MSTQTNSNGHADVNGHDLLNAFLDESIPFETRHMILSDLLGDDDDESRKIVHQLLEQAAKGQSDALAEQKLAEVKQVIDVLKGGALRPATFVGRIEMQGGAGPARVHVRLASGEDALPVVIDDSLLASLRCGDGVFLDAQVRCVLYRQVAPIETGEVVRFERCVNRRLLVATVHGHDTQVFLIGDAVARRIDANELVAGRQLLACLKRQIVFDVVEEEVGSTHYRYLVRDPVPDVVLHRDIGDPPPYIADVLNHIHREMQQPEIGRKYRLRRAMTKLLAGVSGSGKTLSIDATIHAGYELVSSRVGVPIEELPPRVMRLRMAQIANMYFGETDKAIDRFFDEVLRLSEEKFVSPDGVEHELPVYVVIEECDSWGRERSGAGGGEQVYDRIQSGVLLERLDTNSRRFGSKLIIVLCTTNVPQLLDTAFLRRVGGTIEHFGRLSRKSFIAILEKHLAGLPIDETYDVDQGQRERRLMRDAVHWFFAPEAEDPGQVEVTYVGSSQPVTFRRRAFLTAGLIDRAVQQAAQSACVREATGDEASGISRELLLTAFDRQVRALVDQLSIYNIGNHITLPEGVRVAQVRRIEQAKLSSYDLERGRG